MMKLLLQHDGYIETQDGTRPTGAVVGVSCSSLGLMCVAQSCCVSNVFRVACCTFNVSMHGRGGIANAGS
jgi:hypothetical protein